MTIIPTSIAISTHYPIVINRDVVNISKSESAPTFSAAMILMPAVIIKTDFNSGGLPEKRLSSKLYLLQALSSKLGGAISKPAWVPGFLRLGAGQILEYD
jgi:hypothetical protein